MVSAKTSLRTERKSKGPITKPKLESIKTAKKLKLSISKVPYEKFELSPHQIEIREKTLANFLDFMAQVAPFDVLKKGPLDVYFD